MMGIKVKEQDTSISLLKLVGDAGNVASNKVFQGLGNYHR